MGSVNTASRPKIAPKDSGLLERWPGRDNISSFVHCLHLLDLDLLEDWPQITAQTLSTRSPSQNLQQRVKAVEWSLYRLYELYDAHIARDKLRPFFPPQSQLQSQNLRAALLRVLTDLKKTGILGKDVVLRKTTFDECKGEKFEELLAGFANVVLRQRTQLGRISSLGSETALATSRLPFLIAHRVSIRANLEKRQALRKKLLDHEQDLAARRSRLLEAKKDLTRHKGSMNDSNDIAVQNSWEADRSWLAALLQGFPPGEGLLQRADSMSLDHEPTAKLRELQVFAVEQDDRLQRWKTFKSGLPTWTAERRSDAHRGSSDRRQISLNRHHLLRPEESIQCKPQADEDDEDMCKVWTSHQELLLRLSNDLKSSRLHCMKSRPKVSRGSSNYSQDWQKSPGNDQSATCKPAAFPESKAYLSERDANQETGDTHSSILELDTVSQPSPVSPCPEREVNSAESSWIQARDLSPRACLPLENSPATPPPAEAEIPVNSSPPTTPLPKAPLTLLERTRMSLAGAFRDLDSSSSSPVVRIQESHSRDEDVDTPRPVPVSYAGDLTQRTRKSMSLLTTVADLKNTTHGSRSPRISQLYPINPFETPRKSSLQIDVHTPGSNDSTPREKLFSDEADMSSVFKSRPKIAMSPMMSPDRSNIEEDSVLASRAGDMNLDNGSDGGSPH